MVVERLWYYHERAFMMVLMEMMTTNNMAAPYIIYLNRLGECFLPSARVPPTETKEKQKYQGMSSSDNTLSSFKPRVTRMHSHRIKVHTLTYPVEQRMKLYKIEPKFKKTPYQIRITTAPQQWISTPQLLTKLVFSGDEGILPSTQILFAHHLPQKLFSK